MRKFLAMAVVLLFSGIVAFAQTRTISGQVRDVSGAPVPFVTVSEPGNAKNSVSADANGQFSIKVQPATTQLAYTAAGFNAQTVNITGNAVGITLIRDDQKSTMQEVIVTTGLGRIRQKESIGYAAASLSNKELTQGNAVNAAQGLTAKVSGLNIQSVNSGVFNTTRITLRNIRSLTGPNQPMLILDGLPIALSYLSSINPNDIADITILKSASSTAIYGPDGVNGAIVITTKRGSKAKPVITVSQATQFEKIAYMPDFQTRFGGGYAQDATTGDGTFEPIEQQSWGTEFDGSIRQFGQTGPNGETLMLPYSYVPNGRKNFFTTGTTNQTDVSYSAENFYMSAQNASIKGTVPGDENNRRTFTMRAQKDLGKFTAIFNARYTNSKYNVTTQPTLVYYGVTGAPGNYNLGDFKDWRNDYFSSPDGYYTPYLDNNGKTPAFAKDNNRQDGHTDDIFGNVEFNYKASQNLNFVYRVGGSITNDRFTATRGAYVRSVFARTLRDAQTQDITAALTDGNTYSNRLTSEFFANYDKKFGKLTASATAGYSYRQIQSRALSISSTNLGFTDFLSIQNRQGEPGVSIVGGNQKLERYFARLGFDWNKIIFVEGTISRDRDSRLVPKGTFTNKDISAVYPGGSLSVLLHKFIPGIGDGHFLNFAKVRGAISKTGSVGQLVPYTNEATYSAGTFFPFGSVQGYSLSTQLPSAKYDPEFVNTKEVGIELGFLKNRINIEGTYYTQNNTNQIIAVQLSNATGYGTTLKNAAAFKNNGLELDLKLNPLVSFGEVDVNVKANYTYQTSKVTSILPGVDEVGIGSNNYVIVGQSAYVFKLTDYLRDPATGKVIVDKYTGMPSIDPNLKQFGKTTPDNLLGITLNVNWRQLSLTAVADYRTGSQLVADQLGSFLDDNGISARSAANGRRAFVFPNSVYDDGTGKYVDNTNIYTQNYGRLFYNEDINTGAQTNYLADASFWKLREVSLSYTFNPSLFANSKAIKGVTVGLTGRNLLTWLPKSNQWTDPEFSSGTGNAQGTTTAAQLPPTRIMGANVIFQF